MPSANSKILVPTFPVDLVHGFIDLSLGQLNAIRNCSNKIIDLTFASEFANSYVSRIEPLFSPEDAYHPTLEIILEVSAPLLPRPKAKLATFRCFRKAKFIEINVYLSS